MTGLLLLAACGRHEAASAPAKAGPNFAVEKSATAGPVSLTIRLSKGKIGLADHLLMEQEVRADAGFKAELPEFSPDEFTGMGVTAVDDLPSAKDGGATVKRRRLTLEPEKSGTLTIPAFEAWFVKEGTEKDSFVASKPIEVEVAPIEDAAKVDLPDPRPLIAGASRGENRISPYWAALLLVPIVAGAWFYFHRRGARIVPPRPAHEIAWEGFQRLIAAALIEKGEIERFFVALSAILREYVERRFGVRAPERTTKEFLDEAARDARLTEHRRDLAQFLTLADRVKFARFTPEEADVKVAFERARDFVAKTREADHA